MPSGPTSSSSDLHARSRSEDLAARRLLLADDLPGGAPLPEDAPASPTRRRGTFAFVVAFGTALLVALLSWGFSSRIVPGGASLAAGPPAPSPPTGSGLDLRLRISPPAVSRLDGMHLFRQEVGAARGEIILRADGAIDGVRIDSDRVRGLVDVLETRGIAFLELLTAAHAPPLVADGGDWNEWSGRLQMRRALRRLELAGGSLVLDVVEPG